VYALALVPLHVLEPAPEPLPQVEFGEEEGKDRNPILALLVSGR